MATEKSSDTLTATGSEDTLLDTGDDGTYVLCVDLSEMSNGDIVTIRISTKPLSTSTYGIVYQATYRDAQSIPIKESPPVVAPHDFKATLEEESGSNSDYEWSVRYP